MPHWPACWCGARSKMPLYQTIKPLFAASVAAVAVLTASWDAQQGFPANGRGHRGGLDVGSDPGCWRLLRPACPCNRASIASSVNLAGGWMGRAHRQRLCWPHLRTALQALWPSSTGCVCCHWSGCRSLLRAAGPTPAGRHALEPRLTLRTRAPRRASNAWTTRHRPRTRTMPRLRSPS
jgi:hypothetical protein